MKKTLDGKRTLGLFVTSAEDRYENAILRGVFDAAHQRGGHLICFTSGALRSHHGFEAKRNILYDLVTNFTLDGLVISGALGHNIGPAAMQNLCNRYHPLPMVSIALPLEGIPGLRVDSLTGMRRLVNHLIESHKKTRIAFIRGPVGQQEAEERYQAYCDSLADHHIRLDARRVVKGDYTDASGARAAQMLLQEAGRDFDAVVSSNDSMALGAMQVLRECGLRVPEDVPVTGFDDTDDGRYHQPPLTTVRQSPYEQGLQAGRMLFEMLDGRQLPAQNLASAALVIRQSCGCGVNAGQAAQNLNHETPQPLADRRAALRARIATQADLLSASMSDNWIERLLDAVFDSPAGPCPESFLSVWQELLQVEAIVGNETVWFGILDVLQAAPVDAARREQCEQLWFRARLLVNEINARQQAQRRIFFEKQTTALRELGETMLTTFDMGSLLDVIAQKLPGIGVNSCFLSVYENPAEPTGWSRLLLGYDQRGRLTLNSHEVRFSSPELVADSVGFKPGNGCLVVEALYSKTEQLGFVIFEIPPDRTAISGTLRGLLSSALQGILLLQQRQKVEAELRMYQNTLEEMVTSRTEALAETNIRLKLEIEEREGAEKRIRQYAEIVDKMDVGMYVVRAMNLKDDTSLKVMAANPTALRYSGKAHHEVVGRYMHEALTTLYAKQFPQRYLEVMKTGTPAHLEDVYYNTDGSLREAYAVKVFRLTPDSVGVLFENVTARKLAEERLRQFNAELETRVDERTAQLAAANTELEAFSYSVSHDLRAPLRSLSGFSRILLDDFEQDMSPEARGYLGRIHDGALQMGRLIDDLLAFSRLGRQDLKKSTVDMLALAREACDSLAGDHAGRQVRIVFGLLPPAHADPGLMTRVYVNLIGNAIKYTRQRDTAEIEIGCLRRPGTNVYYVRDNGAGFSMQYADKLFGVFQRLHRQDEFEGTGVGLATVKRIIAKHGGKIWVEAEEGKGATFFFTLGSG